MGEMRIIDRSGDAVLKWEPDDKEAVTNAENRFNELVVRGDHTAFEIMPGGKSKKIEKFDAGVGKVTVIPRLAGG